jgi:arylformamidase
MKLHLEIDGKEYSSDLTIEKSIAITLTPTSELFPTAEQPNHFGAPFCNSQTLEMGSYIGDTKRGGSCNANILTIIPHCNGTHTESVSHIVNQLFPVYKAIETSFFPTILITIDPTNSINIPDSYIPCFDDDSKIITRQQLENKLSLFSNEQLQGLVVRTLPNNINKKSVAYNAENYPPFFTREAMQYLVSRKISHLMVDFPSVDKMYDDGQLSNHRLFWNVPLNNKNLQPDSTINKTITEMVYVDDEVKDGFYCCNLQVPEIETDAVPSRPILYPFHLMTDPLSENN